MKLEDFQIGKTFYGLAGFLWLCTDKGTRTVSAIRIDEKLDPLWYAGPPYMVEEVVFNEDDIKSCYTSERDMLKERLSEINNSSHPNFRSEDIVKMIRDRNFDYPRDRILKKDRVDSSGNILHPYSAYLKGDIWIIKCFEIFDRTYSEIPENDFINLKIATEIDLFNKKNKL